MRYRMPWANAPVGRSLSVVAKQDNDARFEASFRRASRDASEAPRTVYDPGKARRRWSINGDFTALDPTGVARYARETTAALDTLVGERHPLARNIEIELVTPRPYALRHIPVRVVPEFRSPRLPQFWVQAQLPRHVPGGLISFCNLAPVFNRRHVACIHDLQTFLMPESYGRGFRLAHRLILPLLGRRAATIATVSSLSRTHLIEHGIAGPEKVTVTYNGADHALRWSTERSRLALPAERPFVACLGRKQPHKNTEIIVRIAGALDAAGIDICIAGDVDAAFLNSLSPQMPANLHLLGRVSDDDLAAILSKAIAFLFPSRIEGFGLPAVEAMTLGCPLIASTSPCIPEVCGDAALYADPDDAAGWTRAVLRLARDPDLRAAMSQKGRVRAERYTWRRVAETYLELLAVIDTQRDAEPRKRGR